MAGLGGNFASSRQPWPVFAYILSSLQALIVDGEGQLYLFYYEWKYSRTSDLSLYSCMIRLFIVDDHALIRDGMRALLSTTKGLHIVGDAAHGQELLDRLPTTPTDVVLMDLNMPVLDGFATLPLLREQFPQIAVLVLTMLAHERYVGQAFDAGAAGYVLKSADQAEIIAAIQAVAAGKRFLSSEIGLALLQKVLHPESALAEVKNTEALSYRELEVLKLISEGLTNNAIAEKLFVSRRTVETHRQNILEKTQMKNTAALVKYAMDHGLLN